MTPISDIRKLALLMTNDIREKWNWLTQRDRKLALLAFEDLLYDLDIPDETLIVAARFYRDVVYYQGRFGVLGPSGSHFLKQMNQFIFYAEHLSKHAHDHSKTTIRKLAELTSEAIQKKQTHKTHLSRLIALASFNKLLLQNKKDEAIIHAAKEHKNYVVNQGRFGFFGRMGSNFLQMMNGFIQKAHHFFHPDEKYIEPIPRYVPSVRELIIKGFEIRNKKYAQLDKIRRALEDEIYESLPRNTVIKQAWHRRIQNGESELSNLVFFKNHKVVIKQLSDELQEKLKNYKTIVKDKDYLNYLHLRYAIFELPFEYQQPHQKKPIIPTKTKRKSITDERPRENDTVIKTETTPKRYVPTTHELLLKGFEIRNKKYVEQNKERLQLEKTIYAALKKYYGDTRLPYIWDRRIHMPGNEKGNLVFFDDYKNEIEKQSDLKSLQTKYEIIMKDDTFLNYLRDYSILSTQLSYDKKRVPIEKTEHKSHDSHKQAHKIKIPPQPQTAHHSLQSLTLFKQANLEAEIRKKALAQFDSENETFVALDKKRSQLENEIYALLKKHHPEQPGHIETHVWRRRMEGVLNNEKDLDDLVFFERYEKEFKNEELRTKANSYKAIVRNKDYIHYIKTRHQLTNASEREIKKSFPSLVA